MPANAVAETVALLGSLSHRAAELAVVYLGLCEVVQSMWEEDQWGWPQDHPFCRERPEPQARDWGASFLGFLNERSWKMTSPADGEQVLNTACVRRRPVLRQFVPGSTLTSNPGNGHG